ncbi:hypothetical protein, partial [Cellulophaga tyrosinoxydans]
GTSANAVSISGDATLANDGTLTIANNAITTSKIIDDAVTAAKINANVAGAGLQQNSTTGALEVDPTAINAALALIATKEDIANKSDAVALGNSATLFPTQNAVKTYVDTQITTSNNLANGTIFIGNGSGTAQSQSIGGDATITNTGILTIANNAITTAKIADLNVTSAKLANDAVTSAKILDNTIVNADINSAAGIAGSKINPTFTANVSTTGTLAAGNTTITGTLAVTGQTTLNSGTAGATTLPTTTGTANQVLTTNGVGAATWASLPTSQNLSNTNLTQTASPRTYDINSGVFSFINGSIGVGTTSPTHSIHSTGSIRVQRGVVLNDGTIGEPALRFEDDLNTGVYSPYQDQITLMSDGIEAIRIGNNQNVGIGNFTPTGNTNPNSTLEVKGSVSTAILLTTANLTLTAAHHTIVITGNHNITLPSANTCTGRIYIIKKPTGSTASITSYINNVGTSSTIFNPGVLQLQSDGANWQQINN